MPVADFPGRRNWGYDGVAPVRAVAASTAARTTCARFVDAAHGLGLARAARRGLQPSGPEGAYLPQFHPRVSSPTGTPRRGAAAINLDGAGLATVRRFIVDNAVHWVREYRLDGLRLDATHALARRQPRCTSSRDARDRRSAARPRRPLHAHRRGSPQPDDARRTASSAAAGGSTAIWADDFHHVVRRQLAGDRARATTQDFEGTTDELARTLHAGLAVHRASTRAHGGSRRGTDPSATADAPLRDLPAESRSGRQPRDRRSPASRRSTPRRGGRRATLLLTAPMTPLLFMGQEWAASQSVPVLHRSRAGARHAGHRGTAPRVHGLSGVRRPGEARARFPMPQARRRSSAAVLDWAERSRPAHARVLGALHANCSALRNDASGARGVERDRAPTPRPWTTTPSRCGARSPGTSGS